MLVILLLTLHRPLRAWWDDDAGNRALLQGRDAEALSWFDAGLRCEPHWALLHEDRGRALLATNPQAALSEFRTAACGTACLAEEGDALAALGRTDEAIDRYVRANAVGRATTIAAEFAGRKDFGRALAIEQALIRHLHDNFVERGDLASSYSAIGKIDASAATQARCTRRGADFGRAAIAAFERARRLAPLNEDYLLSYGFAELEWGSPVRARAAFVELLAIHPAQPEAVAAIARIDREDRQRP